MKPLLCLPNPALCALLLSIASYSGQAADLLIPGEPLVIAGTRGKFDIPARVDQIAYDAESHRVYCTSGTGKIGVVDLESGMLTALGEVSSSEDCQSIAIDPKTHTVRIAYAIGDASFIRPYAAAK